MKTCKDCIYMTCSMDDIDDSLPEINRHYGTCTFKFPPFVNTDSRWRRIDINETNCSLLKERVVGNFVAY